MSSFLVAKTPHRIICHKQNWLHCWKFPCCDLLAEQCPQCESSLAFDLWGETTFVLLIKMSATYCRWQTLDDLSFSLFKSQSMYLKSKIEMTPIWTWCDGYVMICLLFVATTQSGRQETLLHWPIRVMWTMSILAIPL